MSALVPAEYKFPEWGYSKPHRWWDKPGETKRLAEVDLQGHYGILLDCIATVPEGVHYDILRCEPCRRIHVMPLPSHAWLADYYNRVFYEQSHKDYVDRYERDRTWWELWHTTKLEVTECVENSAEERTRRQLKVLDIGAGPGLFLDVAKQRGYQTFGIEPSEMLCTRLHKRGHQVQCGMLDAIPVGLADEPFDLIHMHEVLEHMADPDEVLNCVNSMLADDGHLVVTVPNDYNPLQMMICDLGLVEKKWWLAPPEHLNYFTPKTLQLTLNQGGFKLYDMQPTYPIEQFVIMGENYIGNDELGRQCHIRRMVMETRMYMQGMWPSYLWHLRDMLDQARGGREIIAFATKREALAT